MQAFISARKNTHLTLSCSEVIFVLHKMMTTIMRIILRSYLKTLLTQELQIDIRKKGNLRGIFHDMHMHSACTVFRFCATVCKPVRPMLSDRCLSCLSGCLSVCLSVCDVGVLWPNGWTDQDKTWHARRPRPGPHCVRLGSSSPSPNKVGTATLFSGHVRCGQMAGWTKMPLGMEVCLGPGDLV